MISPLTRSADVDLIVAVDEIVGTQDSLERIEVTVTESNPSNHARTTGGTYEYLVSSYADDPGRLADRFIEQMRYAQYGNADGARIYRPHPDALREATVRASDRREGALTREVATEIRDRLRRGDADR